VNVWHDYIMYSRDEKVFCIACVVYICLRIYV
jgi:hypothetical protein